MRKTAGFTLIELVIVIVILGILGAVAAPKFLNLQGDAYGANLDGLKNSLESAATLGNTKAILAGQDKAADDDAYDVAIEGKNIKFVHGYPAPLTTGILELVEIKVSDAASTDADYIYSGGDDAPLVIKPQARASQNCSVTYGSITSTARPTITIDKTGC